MKKFILFLLVFVFAFVPLEFASWQQFQCNAQHNAAQCDVPINSPLCISWRHKIDGVYSCALPLIDDNGKVYLNSMTSVYRFDAITGAVDWCTNIDPTNSVDGAGILYNNMFIYNYNDGFRALDTGTGNVLWQKDIVGNTGVINFGEGYSCNPIPTLYNGKIYIGDSAGEIIVVNPDTGDTINIFKVTSTGIQAAPAIDTEGVLYFGADDGYFYAIDSNTGAVKWRTYCGNPINASASLDDNAAYVCAQNEILKFNRSDGSIQWSVLMGSFSNSTGTVLNGHYYCGSDDRYVYSIDTNTGEIAWKIYTEDNMCKMSCIIICSKLFVNGCVDKTVMIDVDQGLKEWICHASSGSYTTPAYWNKHIFSTSEDSYLYSIGECGNCPCACDARPTATFEAANPWIVTKTPTISPTSTPTPPPSWTFTITPTYTVTPVLTQTLTCTITVTFTYTLTFTATLTQTLTFTSTPTLVLPPSPTITSTPLPCDGVTPPHFTVKMVYNSDNANNTVFEITSSEPLQSPPKVTVYTEGAGVINANSIKAQCSGNQQALTFTAQPVQGENLEYSLTYPNQAGFSNIDKVVIEGTDMCGVTGTSDGSFDKQVITDQDVKMFSNVIDPDKGDHCTIMYNVYKNDNVIVKIYDRSGTLIKTLVNTAQAQGQYETLWDGTNDNGDKVSSGIYLVVVKTSNYTAKEKIAVTR